MEPTRDWPNALQLIRSKQDDQGRWALNMITPARPGWISVRRNNQQMGDPAGFEGLESGR